MKHKYFLIIAIFIISCSIAKDSFFDKILLTSESFKNTPYTLDPLGEGKGVDTDPIYRFDTFDCLTYVETVLALSIANNDNEFQDLIKKIRYENGKVSFNTRLHFQNPDWLKNNKEYVENISDKLSQKILNKSASISQIKLDKQSWFKKKYNIDISSKIQNVNLAYIPLNDFKNNIDKFSNAITSPYIFMTVISDEKQKEKIGTQVDISHTGFLINKDGTLYLRHASSKHKKVIDENFENYINKLLINKKFKGFSILEIKP